MQVFQLKSSVVCRGFVQKLRDQLRSYMSAVRGSSVIQGRMNFSEIILNYEARGCIPPKKKIRPCWTVHPIYYVQADLAVE
jgi:hypothetical protein